jgi:hypothetical protein
MAIQVAAGRTFWYNVIGHVIAVVVKNPETGEISLERDIAVNADSFDDNELAEATVKTIERKLNEAFPDPNKRESEAKLWVPE